MKLWKAFLVLSAVAAVASAAPQVAFDANTAPALDQDIIDKVNKGNHGWRAGRNSKFEGMTVAEAASRFLRTLLPASADPTALPQVQFHAKDIPNSFDSRTAWKGCVHPIRNQERCGSCWAFAASEALSDRFCVASGGKVDVVLSPEDMVACDTANYGCNGGYINKAWLYLENKGIPTDSCYPYTSGNGNTARCTHGQCQNGDEWKVYKVQKGSSKRLVDEKSIQTDIMNNGPVEAGFMVYQDFFSYSSGVYTHQYGGLAGGHAIKIIGWGVDSNSQKPYWIVANSWGEEWGIKGFFWILRGSDECGIEDQVYAGLPDLS